MPDTAGFAEDSGRHPGAYGTARPAVGSVGHPRSRTERARGRRRPELILNGLEAPPGFSTRGPSSQNPAPGTHGL